MSIHSRLRVVVADENAKRARQGGDRLTLRELSRATGISLSGINGLATDQTRRYDASTLDRLCAYFGVGVADLLEYVPNAGEGNDGNG